MPSFLIPDGKPFWGGTYFRPGRFTHLLERVSILWQQQRPKLVAQANNVATAISKITAASGKARLVYENAIQIAVTNILSGHDDFLGGFGNAPKFPNETWLMLLLESAHRGNQLALAAVEKTLTAIAKGGIYDQVGGGFHRYATDEDWLTPHFEKMLYNQAHLVRAYLLAYQLTGKSVYATVARQTLDYVLREMTSPQGGFYSATDADSEDEEGKYFVWTPAQIRAVLDKEHTQLALSLYDVTEEGNFEGKNILHLPLPLENYAKKHAIPIAQIIEKVNFIRNKLRIARDKREPPLRDDKIITAWNGMMITTLAQAADILGERRYLIAAQRAANLIWAKLKKGHGDLWRIYLHGNVGIPAHQEDYAYFAEALINLYDASDDSIWLKRGREIADGMLAQFWDKAQGGFFMNRADDTTLIARPKSPADRAIPSGNAVAVRVLAMLAARTGTPRYRDKANATINAFSEAITKQPSRYAYMLLAADELLRGEVGMRRYGAGGAVKATAKLASHGQNSWIVVELNIDDGWHINAHKPLQKNLIPTIVSLNKTQTGWQLGTVYYPNPEYLRLSFQQATLALYQGKIRLRGKLIPGVSLVKGKNLLSFQIQFQACDDKSCLPPEDMVFKMAVIRK